MATASLRELNRWTLARQHLLARAALDPVDAVDAVGCLQAQYPPSPYVALWSRLDGFERADLEGALRADLVVKTTVMRGTLHLVTTRHLAHYRLGSGSAYFEAARRDLAATGADLDAVRAAVVAEVARRGHATRAEVVEVIAAHLPAGLPARAAASPSAVAAVAVTRDLVNLADDAMPGWSGGSRYRVGPPVPPVAEADAVRHVATAYLAAFGPATRADLAQWSGRPVGAFAPVLDALDLVTFRADDGRTLLDLPGAPRPDPGTPAPVRLLPKWDSVLLAHARRERVLPEPYRAAVIAKNGDVASTVLVDGSVAGTWTVSPARQRTATVTVSPFAPLRRAARTEVGDEARGLVAWLRPDAAGHDVRWDR